MKNDKPMRELIPNCLYHPHGCGFPQCSGCGFDRAEAERRRKLPLVRGRDGLRRKIIKRQEGA